MELNPNTPQEPLLSKLPDDPDPPKPTQTARTSTRHFERPNYLHIVAHAVWCCAAYPIIYAGTAIVKDTLLFRARAIVGVWCSGIGFVTGWSLVALATKYAEASSTHISHFFAPRGCPTPYLSLFAEHGQRSSISVTVIMVRESN